jgi:molybdate/tungstate transport system ATP-binding protein
MIELEGLSIDLPGFSLDSLSLSVEEGEFFMVVGPSGAGKTLMLEAIAGLRPIAAGQIRIRGTDVTALLPEKRKVALVYQDYALFPHMTVAQNIRWGLRFTPDRDTRHVEGLVRLLKLETLLDRSPTTLSGGEQQRVALARALAVKPSLLLLDEPLSALDPCFREELQDYLGHINREGMTIVMVTHDFGEVLSLGHRVAVLHGGTLQQVGDVREVFQEPVNRQVAEFVGMKNIFPATVKGGRAFLDGGVSFALEGCDESCTGFIGIRPEDVVLDSALQDGSANSFSGRVASIVPRGMAFEVVLQADSFRLTGRTLSSTLLERDIRIGQPCRACFSPGSIHVFEKSAIQNQTEVFPT